jgi:hypothetical protein
VCAVGIFHATESKRQPLHESIFSFKPFLVRATIMYLDAPVYIWGVQVHMACLTGRGEPFQNCLLTPELQ